MNELIFIVEEAPEGGFTVRALGASIFTEADDLAEVHDQVRDAVRCHFESERFQISCKLKAAEKVIEKECFD